MGQVLVPGATAVSEAFSRVNGFIQGCGQAGVLIMAHIMRGTPVSTQQLTEVIRHSVAEGQTVSPGGATTLNQLQAIAQDQGVPTRRVDWRQALGHFAGILPVEVGVSNATALGGNDVGVAGHYIDILGYDPHAGTFLAADPNQHAAQSGQLVAYTPRQLVDAAPFGAVVPDISAQLQQLIRQINAQRQTHAQALTTWSGGAGPASRTR